MKKSIMGIALMAMLTISCTTACGQAKKSTDKAVKSVSQVDTIVTEKAEYHNASGFGNVDIYLELPDGNGTVSSAIRNDLWSKLISTMGADCNFGSTDGELTAYSGDKNLKKMCQYYGNTTFQHWNASMKQQYDESVEYAMNDKEMSAEARKFAIEDTSKYGFDIKLTKKKETKRYVVFYEEVYGYAGGAHGGVYGMGAITYDRKTGKELTNIIKPGMTRAMQPLLKKGLKQYFCECDGVKSMSDSQLYEDLMIEGKTIPLPEQYKVYPSDKGIEFLYGQYEIACYAAGMPSFTIPYSQIKPYLTNEAKQVLGLK